MNFEEKIKEIIDSIYVDIGSIHAKGREVVSNDLNEITKNKTLAIIQLFNDEVEEIRKNAPKTGDSFQNGMYSGFLNAIDQLREKLGGKEVYGKEK